VTALNNLGATALARQDFPRARDHFKQALAIARELGAQYDIALFLLNSSYMEILLGQPDAGKSGLYEAAALAYRLDVPRLLVGAVSLWAILFLAQGQLERCLALLGLARRQPAWGSDLEQTMQLALAPWALEPAVVEAGLAQGAALDWDATVQELRQEAQMAQNKITQRPPSSLRSQR
jgi:hypothetical protein